MTDIGWAGLAITPTFKGLQQDLERGSSKGLAAAGKSGGTKFGDAAGKSAGSRFGSVFKTAAKAGILAGLGGLALGGKLLGDSIGAASDLGETMSKTAAIFGKKATPELEKFASKAAVTLGQSKQQALDAAATFGVFGKSAGLQGRGLVKFSSGLDSLATDLASFSNTSPEEAINAIGSALRGEAEPIRAYGVLLDDATLKAEAMRLGLLKPVKDKNKILAAQARVTAGQAKYNEEVKKHGKDSIEAIKAQGALGTAQSTLGKAVTGTIPALTQQQKVLAAQSSIYRQTKDQQGDFAKTSGGLAGQQKILAARFADTKTALGQGLLPVATKVVTYLNEKGVPQLEKFSGWFTDKGIPAIKRFTEKATPFVKGVLSETRDVLKDIAPYADKLVDAFNKLPDGAKKGLGAAAILGLGASKIPGGKTGGGAVATVAKFVLPKKPIPVVVVNKGGLGGLGKGAGIGAGGAAAGAGIGAGGVLAAGVVALSIYATGVKLFADKVAKDAGVKPFGSPGGPPLDTVLLTPKFGKDKGEALKTAAFYAGNVDKVMDKLPSKIEAGLSPAESLARGIAKVKREAVLTTGQTKAVGDMLFRISQNWDKATAAKDRYNNTQTRTDQGVSGARQGKVDRQLGGGMYVANMNVHGTSLNEVRRDAAHQQRSRAMGAESFE